MRSLQWLTAPVPGVSLGTPTALLKEGYFGLVYLVVRQPPPNRYVITMDSIKKCLEAAANTSAKCRKELPKLPDASVGTFRSLANYASNIFSSACRHSWSGNLLSKLASLSRASCKRTK